MPIASSAISNRRPAPLDRFTSSVRLFLSSTFRDMQAEREALLAQTFPAIRQLCGKAGLGFQEVDLRWGVTAQEAEAGAVLRICLDEIDACRPYFLATIGGRYGWIDPDADRRLSKSFPHLARYADRSVTELEIRHALLDRPEGAQDCIPLIYVREGALTASPDEQPIRSLLADLASAGIPLRPYVSPDDLAVQAASDIATVIGRVIEAAPSRPAAIDQRAYETMLLATGFQREGVLSGLIDTIRRNRNVVVVGPPGSGKSTLLAVLARTAGIRPETAGTASSNAGFFSRVSGLFFRTGDGNDESTLFVSLAAMSGSWRRLSSELCSIAGFEPTLDPIADFDRLLAEFKGTIVIGDLDAAQDVIFEQAEAWLRNPERQAKLVVSTSDKRLAGNLAAQRFARFEMPCVTPVDRSAMVESILGGFGKRLDRKQQQMVHDASMASPALLRIVCEEMRHLGLFEEVDVTLRGLLSLKEEREAFEAILARLESVQDRPELVARVLCLLRAARGGLSERELQSLLGIADAPLPMLRLSAILVPLRPYLLDRRGVLSVAYPALEAAITARYRGDDADAFQERSELIGHFLSDRFSERAIDELPWLIAMTRDARAAEVLATDTPWLAAAMHRDPVACRAFLRSLSGLDRRVAQSAVTAALKAMTDAACDDETAAVALQAAVALGAADAATAPAVNRAAQSRSAALLDACADCLIASGRPTEALSVLQRLRKILDGSGEAARQASAVDRAGAVAQQMGDAELARMLFMEAVAAHSGRGDRWAAARASANVGTALLDLGRYREADRLFAEVEAEARRRHDYEATALALGGRGIVQRFAGKPRKALALLAEEARRWRLGGSHGRLANSLVNQARCAIDLDDFDAADMLIDAAQVEARSAGDRSMEISAITLRIEILQRIGLGDGARSRKLAAERDALKASARNAPQTTGNLANGLPAGSVHQGRTD